MIQGALVKSLEKYNTYLPNGSFNGIVYNTKTHAATTCIICPSKYHLILSSEYCNIYYAYYYYLLF